MTSQGSPWIEKGLCKHGTRRGKPQKKPANRNTTEKGLKKKRRYVFRTKKRKVFSGKALHVEW